MTTIKGSSKESGDQKNENNSYIQNDSWAMK